MSNYKIHIYCSIREPTRFTIISLLQKARNVRGNNYADITWRCWGCRCVGGWIIKWTPHLL